MMIWKWGGMCIGLLFLVFIGLIVYLIVKSAKTIPTKVYFKENNSLEILKRCYAKGEVNEKEYHRMKKDLQEDKCEKEDYEIVYCANSILKFLFPFGIIAIIYRFYVFIKYSPCELYLLENDSESKILPNDKDKIIILSWLVLLILLFCPFYLYSYYQSIVLFLIIWRLAEILVYQSSIIYQGIASIPRSITLFLINFSEVIFIYAILYLSLGAIGYCNYKAIQKPFEALYFSVLTILTAGSGDIITINNCGKILVFSETVIGILLLVIFFGVLIGTGKSKDDKNHDLLNEVYEQNKKIYNTLKHEE
jgi:hypothetical protein